MSPFNLVRRSLDTAAAIVATTLALGYITVTSGPLIAYRYGPGA